MSSSARQRWSFLSLTVSYQNRIMLTAMLTVSRLNMKALKIMFENWNDYKLNIWNFVYTASVQTITISHVQWTLFQIFSPNS